MTVPCLICGERLKIINSTHLHKHNLSMLQYRLQFPNAVLTSEETKVLIGNASRGRKHSEEWNENIGNGNRGKKRSEELRSRLRKLHLGKTHNIEWKNNQSIAQLHRYENLKEREKTGDITRERFKNPKERKKISDAIRKRNENPEEIEKMSRAQKKNWSDPVRHKTASDRVRKAYSEGDIKYLNITRESDCHKSKKNKIAKELTSLGLSIEMEKFVTINGHRYAVDIYAKRQNGDIMIFEIGDCKKKKLNDLQSYYPLVFHVPKFNEEVII